MLKLPFSSKMIRFFCFVGKHHTAIAQEIKHWGTENKSLAFSLQQMCAGKHSGSVAYARREKLQYQLWRLQSTPERLTTFTVWENQLLLKHWSTTKQLLRNRVNQCWIIMLLRKQKKIESTFNIRASLSIKQKTLNNHKNCFYLFIETCEDLMISAFSWCEGSFMMWAIKITM